MRSGANPMSQGPLLAFAWPSPDPAGALHRWLPHHPLRFDFSQVGFFFFFLALTAWFCLVSLLCFFKSLAKKTKHPQEDAETQHTFTIEAQVLFPGEGEAQAQAGRHGGRGAVLGAGGPLPSHDAVGEVLEAIVELGGDGAHAAIHHLLNEQLQLLLRHVHVETLLQVADGARAVEAGEL